MTIGSIGDVTSANAVCAIDPMTGMLEDISTGAPCVDVSTQSGGGSSLSPWLLIPIGILAVFAFMGARR